MSEKTYTPEQIAALLAALGVDEEKMETAATLLDVAAAETAAINALAAKCVEGSDLSDVRTTVFSFASIVAENITMNAGDPKGGNKNTRADRHHFECPTPMGRLVVALYRD